MVRLYNTIPPIVLLISGWVLIIVAAGIRILAGDMVPWLNVLFLLAGLAIFFLPPRMTDINKGEELRRKLLWVLVLAGFVLTIGETVKAFTGNTT